MADLTVGPDSCGAVAVVTVGQLREWGMLHAVRWGGTAVVTTGSSSQAMEGRVDLDMVYGYGHPGAFTFKEEAVVVKESSLFSLLLSNGVLRSIPHTMHGGRRAGDRAGVRDPEWSAHHSAAAGGASRGWGSARKGGSLRRGRRGHGRNLRSCGRVSGFSRGT